MFKIDTNRSYWWPVLVRRPDADKPGQMAEHKFEVQLRWLDDAEHKAWLERVGKDKLEDGQAVEELVSSFRDVQGRDGSLLEPTPANLKLLLAEQGVGTAIARAYFGSRERAAEKN